MQMPSGNKVQKTVLYSKLILIVLTCSIILTFTPFNTISASETGTIKLFNYTTNQTESYTKTALSYICNGNTLDLTKTPAILSDNGVALCSFNSLFQKELGLTCNYDSATNSVTIAGNSMMIKLTVGSKTAYVNNKAVTITAAPVKLKYIDSNITRVLVPTRFVCETLGYSYLWNSTNSTISITTPLKIAYDNTSVVYSNIRANVYADSKLIQQSSLPAIKINNTILGQAKKLFTTSELGVECLYDKKNNTLKLVKGDISLVYTLGNDTAYINDVAYNCGVAPRIITNTDTNAYAVFVPVKFTASALGYEYIWDYKTNSCSINTTVNTGVAANVLPGITSVGQGNETSEYQILIPLPDGVTLENLTLDDRYHSKQIAICL